MRPYSLVIAITITLIGSDVSAQKANDTLRMSVNQPIRLLDSIQNPNPEASLISRNVNETLLAYDVVERRLSPRLASEWRMVDDRTAEVKLRSGLRFHDGAPFTADDVIYTLEYVTDPKTNFLFKDTRFGWIEAFEKISADTVRIRSREVKATILTKLVQVPPIVPAHLYKENPADFGRAPVGTGQFRAVSVDSAKGIILEKFTEYTEVGVESAAQVRRIEVASIADIQTKIAKLLVGELDLVFDLDADTAQSLLNHPTLKVTSAPTLSFSYIGFDAANRSGIKVLKDRRVREALLRAIDRNKLRVALLPKDMADKPAQEAMCHPSLIGCAWSQKPGSYGPVLAKALLAEAGLSDCFDLEISTWGQPKRAAEAVAGELRKIGVRATVSNQTANVFQKNRGDGKVQAMIVLWDNAAGQPDVEATSNFFFAESSRNYNEDPDLIRWDREGSITQNLHAREEIYRKLFDKVTEERYAMPLAELPAVIAHDKDLLLLGGNGRPEGFSLNRVKCKK